MTDRVENGIVLGRFQPLHIGHIEYLEAAKRECVRLYVGITNPDNRSRIATEADPRRSLADSNPFTYLERLLMIEDSLLGMGWRSRDFCIVPAPVLEPDSLVSYLPPAHCARAFLTIYDDWGERKREIIESLNYPVHVLWRRSYGQRVTSGTAIRNSIRTGRPWRHLVPQQVAYHVERLMERVGDYGTFAG